MARGFRWSVSRTGGAWDGFANCPPNDGRPTTSAPTWLGTTRRTTSPRRWAPDTCSPATRRPTGGGDGLLPANPCQIKRAMNTPRQRQPVILTVAEVAALADAIEPQRLRALVLISAWCGLRWGEVIELRRKDVSVDASVLSVGRGATHR